LVGFIYGVVTSIKKKQPLYYIMIVASVGTTAFSRLLEVVYMWTTEEYFDGFHIGILGTIATFLFIFTANFGTMDTIGDDHSKRLMKYRIIALVAPVVVASFFVPIALSKANLSTKISFGAIYIVMMASTYFNLKHLILPDVDYGIIKCIRGYNALMLCYSVLFALERIALVYNQDIMLYVVTSLIAVDSLLIVPVLRKGASKWTI
jgi:hypothetical protein